MEKGDVVGAFDQDGRLCGFAEITNILQPQAIILVGDDATTIEKMAFRKVKTLVSDF